MSSKSIYRADVTAVDLVTNIKANQKSSKFIIYLDTKSVLLAQLKKDTLTFLITKLQNKMNTLSINKSIILSLIPSHIDMYRNKKTDKAATKKHS